MSASEMNSACQLQLASKAFWSCYSPLIQQSALSAYLYTDTWMAAQFLQPFVTMKLKLSDVRQPLSNFFYLF